MGFTDANTIFVEANNNLMGSNSDETFTSAFQLTEGWNLIGGYYDGNNFDPLTSVGVNYGWNIMYDGTTATSDPIIHATGNYTDADTFITGVGGEKTNQGNSRNSLVGMTNQVQAYSDPITIGQMQSMVSYNCDQPCPMCLAKQAPTCQEYVPEAFIGKWDFQSSVYQKTITDQGMNGMNLELINNQSSYDPVYVDNQGLYFNGRNSISSPNLWNQNNVESFTFESWIRPLGATLTDQVLFSLDTDPHVPEFAVKLNPTSIEVDVHGVAVNFPITAPVIEDWTYVGVSIMKIQNNRVRAGVFVGTGPEVCNNINSELNFDAAGDYFHFGSKYKGMMKEATILDWPKKGYEFSSMVQTAGCLAFNSVPCATCPSTTGECISQCQTNEYGPNCDTGLEPNGATGYGNTFDQCFSGLTGFDFTYEGQSCPGICGNGVVETYLGEQGDDGNDQENDGCSSACLIEPGFECSEKTVNSASVCTRKGSYEFGFYFGFLECNDGNDDPLDGCFNCKIERGWKCEDGSPWNPDVCTELCGDGINYGEHECDDAAHNNGDGCNAICVIELQTPPQWIGSSGNELAPDFCHAWGGNGIREEDPYLWNPRRNLFRLQEVTGDEGNLRSGEGGDGIGRIENGFVGGGIAPDVCTEECGDRRAFYYDQCDDGNLDPGDGGRADCLMEAGYECLGGGPQKVTDGGEVGGDNINNGWHTGDHGNIIGGDGGSATGQTEPGYRCSGGDNDEGDVCTEKGGDGKNAGLLPGDDYNLNDGDGCNSTGYVESGYTCTGGSPTTRDTCVETCGDGVDMDTYEGDDGNVKDGDGGTSTGTIEPGWGCIKGSPYYCYKASRPAIQSATINSDSSEIFILFNATVKFTTDWKSTDWRVEMFLPNKETVSDFNYTITPPSDVNTIQIELTYDQQLFGYNMEYIVLTFYNRHTTVETTYSTEMINKQATFYLPGKEVSKNAKMVGTLGTLTYLLFIICVIIGFVALVLGYQTNVILDGFYTLQLIYFFPLGRFYMPTGLFKFFKAFEKLNFQGFNFGIWDFNEASDIGLLTVNGDVINYNFQKMGFSNSSFVFTSIDVILCIIYLLFLMIGFRILGQVFRKTVWVRNIESIMVKGILLFILNSTGGILCLTAFLNISDWNVMSEAEAFGSITSYLYLAMMTFALIVVTIFTALHWNDLKQAKSSDNNENDKMMKVNTIGKRYLFTAFKDRNLMHYSYPAIFLTRRILVAAIYAFIKYDGFLQLLGLSLLSGMMLVYHTSYQPFTSSFRNNILTLLELAYLVIGMTIFPYVYPNLKKDLFLGQADVVVGLFLILFFTALFIPTGILLCKLCSKRPKNHPIFKKDLPLEADDNMRNEWITGQKKELKEEQEKEKVEDKIAAVDQTVTEKDKPEDDASESLESEESEFQTETITITESSSSDENEGDLDGFAAQKRIPAADVNLDTQAGFSTGMTGTLEAEIQKYRQQEKKLN